MPDSPRPSIAFPAFQTPAGLLPQADREHRSDYAETQGQASELSRRTDGYWIDVPYSPARYLAPPPAMWIVPKSEVFTARYKIVGGLLSLHVSIWGSVQVGPAAALQIVLPERRIARQYAFGLAFLANATGFAVNAWQIAAGSGIVSFYAKDYAPWPVGAIRVGAQLAIEVEEQ
jgi:hypothetical protein